MFRGGSPASGNASITGGNLSFIPSGGASFVPVSCPVDVTEDTLATITIPVLSATSIIRVYTFWTHTNSVNNKTLRVRFSGAAGTQYLAAVVTTTATSEVMTVIGNTGATNSQAGGMFSSVTSTFGTTTNGGVTSAVDTTAATSVVITGQKALNSETLTLTGYIVEVYKP